MCTCVIADSEHMSQIKDRSGTVCFNSTLSEGVKVMYDTHKQEYKNAHDMNTYNIHEFLPGTITFL